MKRGGISEVKKQEWSERNTRKTEMWGFYGM